MRIDIHFHVLGSGRDLRNLHNDVYFNPYDNQHWFTRILYNLIERDLKRLEADLNRDGSISTDEYFELLYRTLCTSEELDAVVLLALDGVYSPRTGQLDERRTDLLVSNRFLYRKVQQLNERLQRESEERLRKKRFLFGASVNPNRRDWESELHWVLTQTDAVLLKLIPSVQHVDLMEYRHRDFFDTLAKYQMPLLCHVGPEYSFPEGMRHRNLDSFTKLQRPLECGVRVIAAHCAAPVFPVIDRDHTGEFASFMEEANATTSCLYADTSALSLSTRIHLLPRILELFPPEWLLHGSDFPIPVDGWVHLPYITRDITPQEYMEIVKTSNPLDRDVRLKRACGFSDEILTNGGHILRVVD